MVSDVNLHPYTSRAVPAHKAVGDAARRGRHHSLPQLHGEQQASLAEASSNSTYGYMTIVIYVNYSVKFHLSDPIRCLALGKQVCGVHRGRVWARRPGRAGQRRGVLCIPRRASPRARARRRAVTELAPGVRLGYSKIG